MNAQHREPPSTFEKARDHFLRAIEACDRQSLRDALARGGDAVSLLETEEQFRAARRGAA